MSLLCRGLHVFKKIIINHYGNCTAGADPGIFDGGGGGQTLERTVELFCGKSLEFSLVAKCNTFH